MAVCRSSRTDKAMAMAVAGHTSHTAAPVVGKMAADIVDAIAVAGRSTSKEEWPTLIRFVG